MEQEIALAATLLSKAKNIVAFTGAGISQDSGIPTFRDSGGLWDRYQPELFGSMGGIKETASREPERLLSYFNEILTTFLQASPNISHEVIASLEKNGHRVTVITQNVDDLHERAGSTIVHKLHGDLYSFRCLNCGKIHCNMRPTLEKIYNDIKMLISSGTLELSSELYQLLPKCSCGGWLRPEVVLFGEGLPEVAWEAASEALIRAHVLLVIGTSVEVYPASSLPKLAYQMNVPIIEINPRPVLRHNAVTLKANAAEVFAQLAQLLEA